MESTSQKETLSGKAELEILAATFGVKINRYHADNVIFSEQPFRTEIEESNATKSFCVGLDHINKILLLKEKQNSCTRSYNIASA